MTKLTPGIWYADGNLVCVDQGDTRHVLATVSEHYEGDNANAELMARAPVLLGLVREALHALNQVPNTPYHSARYKDTYKLASVLQRTITELEN